MAKISVIIPVYKTELYLRRCVDSVLNQSFYDFDLILVDDGSPDQCPGICDEYAINDSRVHVIHQKNNGPSVARNNGIDWAFSESNSKYLAFVDSDDYLHPQFLEYMYYAVENNMAEISMCRHKYVTENENLETIEKYEINSVKEISAEELMVKEWGSFNYVWGKLYHKKCFQSLRYPENISFGEDNLIIFKAMFESSKIIFVDCQLYYYFYNSTGITKSPWTPKSLGVFEGIQVQLEYYKEHGYHKAYEKEIELYIQQYAYQMHRIREDKENFVKNKPYLDRMKIKMKALLEESKVYKARDNFYWYEALYPEKAKVLDLAGRIKRNLKENGLGKTVKQLNRKTKRNGKQN